MRKVAPTLIILCLTCTMAFAQTPSTPNTGDSFNVNTGVVVGSERACDEARSLQQSTAHVQYNQELRACGSEMSCLATAFTKWTTASRDADCRAEKCKLQAQRFSSDCDGAKTAAVTAAHVQYSCDIKTCGSDQSCNAAAYATWITASKDAESRYAQCRLTASRGDVPQPGPRPAPPSVGPDPPRALPQVQDRCTTPECKCMQAGEVPSLQGRILLAQAVPTYVYGPYPPGLDGFLLKKLLDPPRHGPLEEVTFSPLCDAYLLGGGAQRMLEWLVVQYQNVQARIQSLQPRGVHRSPAENDQLNAAGDQANLLRLAIKGLHSKYDEALKRNPLAQPSVTLNFPF